MSQYLEGSNKGFIAGANLADGVAVKIGTGRTVVVATSPADAILGVMLGDAVSGSSASVRLRSASGTSKGKAGATLAVGSPLTVNGSGLLIVATTAGQQLVGYSLDVAANGDFFEFVPSTGKF